MYEKYYIIFLAVILPFALLPSGEVFLQFLQLSGYRTGKSFFRVFKLCKAWYIILLSAAFFCADVCGTPVFLSYPIYLVGVVTAGILNKRESGRTPLVYTGRVKRIAVAAALAESAFILVNPFLSGLLFPALITATFYALYPFEKLNNFRYVMRASKKLKASGALIVAVTGSFGKTTVKNLITGLISDSFKTLTTPLSYNTPLGIARTINGAREGFEVFAVEFGARRLGEIRYLTKYFPPDVAVISGIAAQHIETFKSVENVVKGKLEILHNNPKSCIYIINADNDILKKELKTAAPEEGKPLIFCGFTGEDVKVTMIETEGEQSRFTLCFGTLPAMKTITKKREEEDPNAATADIDEMGCEELYARTSLLGKHNLVNISLAAAVAKILGIASEKIEERIYRLKQIPHRLELLRGQGGLNIIDDSYNANPEGVKNALEVLMSFSGAKYVITCGIVEQGKLQAATNRDLGARIARIADAVVLIGANAVHIKEGLTEEGFHEKNILSAKNPHDAVILLQSRFASGDTILFLNDLPDNF